MIHVIYDNTCPFCYNSKLFFNKLDYYNIFLWIPAKENKDKRLNSNILDSTIVVIDKSDRILIEFKACRYIMTRIPFFHPIIIFLYIPFISLYCGNMIYRIISQNRKCKTSL